MLWVPLDPHYCKLRENQEKSPWFCPVFSMLWGVRALLAAALIQPPSLYLNFLVLLINILADSFIAVVCFGEMGVSLSNQGWPQTLCQPLASASQALGFPELGTVPS